MQMTSNFKLPADGAKHAITFLTPNGKEKGSTQGNLFEVIQKYERRFVVDNHIDWFGLSALPENSNVAFILGTTTDRESCSLKSLFEDKTGKPKVRQNVFMFGMQSPKRPTQQEVLAGHLPPLTPDLVISRLDEYATLVLDMEGIRKFEQPDGEKKKFDSSWSIADERKNMLSLLSVNRIEDIEQMPELPDRQMKDDKLRLEIERKKPKCFKRFWESHDVARFAYSRLLLFSGKARNEFSKPNYPNVFGDLHLIQNALFFNAGFASDDWAVKKMAIHCGLQRFETQTCTGRCACQPTENN
jgi:hypothetical protein